MTTTKLSRLALSLVVTLLLLGFSPVLSADTILEISQPSWDFSFNDASGWQSFTVTESSKLTTFGFLLNGVYGAGTKPGTLKLWAGEGTTNFIMEVAANDVLAGSGPYDGVEFFQGDFGGVGLNSGQYTVSFQWTHDWL
ncbi:MAG: hypothetical protein WCH84_06665, partial [Verrucomicrobiota bacterium]